MKEFTKVSNLTAGDFPPAVRPFWQNASNFQLRLALTLAAIVCYSSLGIRLRVKYYYDMTISMLLLNLLVIGHSGSGKNLVKWVVNLLLKDLIARDQEERRKYREHKKARSGKKGAKKEGAEDEYQVVVRFLQKFTLPIIVKYADLFYQRYHDWGSFMLYADEMAAFTENKRGNSEFQAVARTAYSLGELYSRDTLYEGGYNALVDICWNSIICGQEPALAKYIDKEGVVLGDAGRQMLVKLDSNLGGDALTIKPFTEEQLAEVHKAMSLLLSESFTDDDQLQPIHVVDMAWLDKDVKAWCKAIRDQILKNGSDAMNSFYVRASSSAFRIATILYHLWGEDVNKQKNVRRCYYAFAQLILDNNMAQWGKMYEDGTPKEKEVIEKRPTLFDSMQKQFSRQDLREMIVTLGLRTGARHFIHKWLEKKWIFEVEKGSDVYEKIY